MSFSHRRENDEKSRRDSRLGLSSCYWEAYTHGSKGVAVLAELAQATTHRAGSDCRWKLRACRRKTAGAHSWRAQTVKPKACGFFP